MSETTQPEARRRGAIRTWLRRNALPPVVVLAVLAPMRSVVADWNDVPTGSMRPTILEGDRIFVNKLAFGLRVPFTHLWIAQWDGPDRGDIVTLRSPADGVRLVKRVVGLPGDRIAIHNGRVVINGAPVPYEGDEAYSPAAISHRVRVFNEQLPGRRHLVAFTLNAPNSRHMGEVRIPKDHYLVLGDNRDRSRDSRAFGLVHRDDLYGRTDYVALSLNPARNYKPRFDRWLMRLE